MIEIRRASGRDIPAVIKLLREVLEIHAAARPDIFVTGTTKYSPEELEEMFADDSRPVFAACGEDGEVLGYIMCDVQKAGHSAALRDITTLYIDDLCVDEKARGMHIGQKLFEYAVSYAAEIGCHNITLNVWEGNESARRFYEKMGMGVQKTCMEMVLDKKNTE